MSTTTEHNKTAIRHFVEAWNNRQPEAFDELMSPDVVRHCQATPAVEVRSLKQVKEFLRQDTASFPDSRQTIVQTDFAPQPGRCSVASRLRPGRLESRVHGFHVRASPLDVGRCCQQ